VCNYIEGMEIDVCMLLWSLQCVVNMFSRDDAVLTKKSSSVERL